MVCLFVHLKNLTYLPHKRVTHTYRENAILSSNRANSRGFGNYIMSKDWIYPTICMLLFVFWQYQQWYTLSGP